MGGLLDEVEVGNPQQPHCATVLLLDTSGSMDGANITAVNEGLKIFKEEVLKDEVASKRVDIAVITFSDSAQLLHDFSSMDAFDPPRLEAGGATAMAGGISMAIEVIERRKKAYKDQGIDYYRPWLFMVTDGEPSDMKPGDEIWNSVIHRVHESEASRKFLFFLVSAEQANMDTLKQIAPPNRAPLRMAPGKWKELFQWLSRSQSAVSGSKVGEQVELPPIAGWAQI